MVKKLNEDTLKSELSGSSFFARAQTPPDSPTLSQEEPSLEIDTVKQKPTQKAKAPQGTTIAPAGAEKTEEPRVAKVEKVDSSPILGRPKAFYITADQDRNLDTLVAEISLRLMGRLNFKVDRSIVVRLILESSDLTSSKTIDRLADELVGRVVSRLTG